MSAPTAFLVTVEVPFPGPTLNDPKVAHRWTLRILADTADAAKGKVLDIYGGTVILDCQPMPQGEAHGT